MEPTLNQLKYELHLKIDAIESEEQLLELLLAMQEELPQFAEPDPYYALKSRVAAAEREIDAGDFVTHEDVKREAEDW